jgi:hypothetical protein
VPISQHAATRFWQSKGSKKKHSVTRDRKDRDCICKPVEFNSALTKKARLYLVRNYSKNLGRSRAWFPRAKLRFARARKIGFVSQKRLGADS